MLLVALVVGAALGSYALLRAYFVLRRRLAKDGHLDAGYDAVGLVEQPTTRRAPSVRCEPEGASRA